MAKNKKQDKDKIGFKRMMSNIFYVMKFAVKEDKKMFFAYLFGYVLHTVGFAIFDSYVCMAIINAISEGASISRIIVLILLGMLVVITAIIPNCLLQNFFETRIIKVTGNISRQFLTKASNIDLICYDDPEYFNDFVIAATQAEEMIKSSVVSFTYTLGNSLAVLTAASMIFTVNPVVAAFPVIGFIVNLITRFAITKQEYKYTLEKKRINRKSDYSKRVFYQPEFAKEIKLSGIALPLIKQFNESIDEEKQMAKKYGIKISILSFINWVIVFTFLSMFCVPVYLGYLALVKMSISLGEVAGMQNAADTISHSLDDTNYALVDLQKVGQYAEKFRKFVEHEENIEVFKSDIPIPQNSTIEIKNMSYKYDGADKYSLKNINMTIKPKEKIAIVGENGAGKTTLIKLLMHLYNVTDGEITYGGININELTTKDYRKKIGAVFQDYQIYAASLGENVKMDFCEDNDESDIKDALSLADFNSKLDKLPEGLKTEMTREFFEDGTTLSGGESQKVAIGRMFMKDNNISVAILDEPSSALDPIAEYTLNKNMMEDVKDSTIIFISHRLSTTRDADKIYMFEHGEIVEEGTHDELMALNGEYAEMFEKQAHYYKLKI